MKIIPFFTMYPTIDHLSKDQNDCYRMIQDCLTNLQYIDVEENDSYIMLYLNELVQQLINDNEPSDYYSTKFEFIKSHYFATFVQDYCTLWLGDVYFYLGDMNNAIKTWQNGLNVDKIWTLLSSKVISLKLYENIKLNAIEVLSYKKNITKYAKKNMDLVVKYVDNIISQDYNDGTISNEFFLDSNDKETLPACLFTGCTYGFELNYKYQQHKKCQTELRIESLKNLTDYIGDVSRRAENAIREDLNMPRIGEGWISETELYYKVKEYFSKYTVIQHYNSEWLGKQHLDVYIQDINIGIEYHGLQHFEPVEFFGGEEAFKENQKRDKTKLRKCNKNNTKLFVVSDGYCFNELIKKIENEVSE